MVSQPICHSNGYISEAIDTNLVAGPQATQDGTGDHEEFPLLELHLSGTSPYLQELGDLHDTSFDIGAAGWPEQCKKGHWIELIKVPATPAHPLAFPFVAQFFHQTECIPRRYTDCSTMATVPNCKTKRLHCTCENNVSHTLSTSPTRLCMSLEFGLLTPTSWTLFALGRTRSHLNHRQCVDARPSYTSCFNQIFESRSKCHHMPHCCSLCSRSWRNLLTKHHPTRPLLTCTRNPRMHGCKQVELCSHNFL